MIGLAPLVWEVISAVLGLGALSAMGSRFFNPVYMVRIVPQPSGKILVRVGRAWRFGGQEVGEVLNSTDDYRTELLRLVDEAEERVSVHNVLRKSFLPKRKSLRQQRLQIQGGTA